MNGVEKSTGVVRDFEAPRIEKVPKGISTRLPQEMLKLIGSIGGWGGGPVSGKKKEENIFAT